MVIAGEVGPGQAAGVIRMVREMDSPEMRDAGLRLTLKLPELARGSCGAAAARRVTVTVAIAVAIAVVVATVSLGCHTCVHMNRFSPRKRLSSAHPLNS